MSAAHIPSPAENPRLAPVPSQVPPPEPKSRKWLIWLVVVVIGAAGAWYLTQPAKKAVPAAAGTPETFRTAAATSGSIDRVIRVAGQTTAVQYASLTAPMMKGPEANREMILLTVAPAGSWVKKGTIVGQIDGQGLQDHIDDLLDTIDSAKADVSKRQAEQAIELENLQQSLRVAKSAEDKARLEYNGSETQTDIQRQLLKLTLDEAEASTKQITADISQKKLSQQSEVKILELTLERHTRHRNRHINDLKSFTITASMDGLVVMQQIFRGSEMGTVQQGDRVFPGQPFMKIVNTKHMQVEGTVNQAESGDFRIGQQGTVSLDAFGGLHFPATVHSIGALAAAGQRNSYFVRTVPIRLNIEGNDPKLIPDLSASADVIVQSGGNQTLVPISAVDDEGGQSVVYVKSGEGFEKRPVKTGLRNDTQIAVLTGLKAGEVVRLN